MIYEAPVVLGISESNADGCLSLASTSESNPFIIITKNSYGCELGEVSAKAKFLGATLLVIAPRIPEDMTRYIGWDGTADTVPTVVAYNDFVDLALGYITSEMVFKVDYTLKTNSPVDYTFYMVSNPLLDS